MKSADAPQTPQKQEDVPYVSKVDRRTALVWMGVASVGAGSLLAAFEGRQRAPSGPAAKGYGADPDLINPTAPWPRLMSALQLQTAAHLCDFILPASADSPSASAVGVPDFLNEWVSAPYPEQLEDRSLLLPGLDRIDREARRHGASLSSLAPTAREALFRGLMENRKIALPGRAQALERLVKGPVYDALFAGNAFFRRVRLLTVGAYYTTDAGFKDIGYLGNVALTRYEGPTEATKAEIDARLKRRGV